MFDETFSFPILNTEEFVTLRSIYIHVFGSNSLFVEGGPKISKISLLFVEFIINLLLFLFKLFIPCDFFISLKEQFEMIINNINKNKFFMSSNKTNLYNNFVKISRNNELYEKFTKQDSFSDRLSILLIHFAFFIKYKKESYSIDILQETHDNFFRSLESDIRETGHGDVTVNKKMKDYLNKFYDILSKIHNWDNLIISEKSEVIKNVLNINTSIDELIKYFDLFVKFSRNKSLNYFTKGVISIKF